MCSVADTAIQVTLHSSCGPLLHTLQRTKRLPQLANLALPFAARKRPVGLTLHEEPLRCYYVLTQHTTFLAYHTDQVHQDLLDQLLPVGPVSTSLPATPDAYGHAAAAPPTREEPISPIETAGRLFSVVFFGDDYHMYTTWQTCTGAFGPRRKQIRHEPDGPNAALLG